MSHPPLASSKTVSSTACVCATFRKATRALTLFYDEHLRPAGLRVTQYSLLRNVLAREPITVNRLADVTVTDRTTLTRNLRILEQAGFILIQPGQDRRAREVTITPKGREVIDRANPYWERAQADVLTRIGHEHWEILRQELTTMIELGRER